MKNPSTKYLHELPAFKEFTHEGKLYRTITWIKQTVVSRCHAKHVREVLNLGTFKSEMLNYFTQVSLNN